MSIIDATRKSPVVAGVSEGARQPRATGESAAAYDKGVSTERPGDACDAPGAWHHETRS